MPTTFTLDLKGYRKYPELVEQLTKQGVSEKQADDILAHFEWTADDSPAAYMEKIFKVNNDKLPPALVTLSLPTPAGKAASDRTKRQKGTAWLRHVISICARRNELPESLEARKEKLLEPIYDKYTVTVNDGTKFEDLEKELKKQNVSLATLQARGYHVRATEVDDQGTQTLTFKRLATSRRRFQNTRQFFSDRANKLRRGQDAMQDILQRSTMTSAEQKQMVAGFSTVNTLAEKITVNCKPDYAILKSKLEAEGTSLEALAKAGYHVRASKPDNKGRVDFTFSISKSLTWHDTKLQRGAELFMNLINQAKWNNEIEDAQANNLITVLTTDSPNVHFELEWPSADPIAHRLIREPDHLDLLSWIGNERAQRILDDLAKISCVLPPESGIGRLLHYRAIFHDLRDAKEHFAKKRSKEIADFRAEITLKQKALERAEKDLKDFQNPSQEKMKELQRLKPGVVMSIAQQKEEGIEERKQYIKALENELTRLQAELPHEIQNLLKQRDENPDLLQKYKNAIDYFLPGSEEATLTKDLMAFNPTTSLDLIEAASPEQTRNSLAVDR